MKKHYLLGKYIEGLIKGYANSLIVESSAGLGKSETTINALKRAGLKKDEHYIYITNYLTPKALVGLLEATNKLSSPRILVIDEAEHAFGDLDIVGILKSALWEVGGERKVYWITSKEHIEFNFNGKIIFILNKINKKSEVVNAVIDRSLFYKISFTEQEIKELIIERAKQPYLATSYQQRMRVATFLSKTSTGKLTLRTFPKVLNLMLLSPNHWEELSSTLLENK